MKNIGIIFYLSFTMFASMFGADLKPSTPIDQKEAASVLPAEAEVTLDKFIYDFVKQVGSDRVSYDGKTLVLYKASNPTALWGSSVGVLLSAVGGGLALAYGNDKIKVVGVMASLYFAVLFSYLLSVTIDNTLNKNPCLILDEHGLVAYDNKMGSKWSAIDQIKDDLAAILLCDQYLNTRYQIICNNGDLAISRNNLIAILRHYVEKNKQNKQTADSVATTK